MDKGLREAIQLKHSTHRIWMARKRGRGAEEARLNYTKARNKVSKLLRQSKRKYESDIASKAKSNPKSFWSHIRGKLKTKPGISPLFADKNKKILKYNVRGDNVRRDHVPLPNLIGSTSFSFLLVFYQRSVTGRVI